MISDWNKKIKIVLIIEVIYCGFYLYSNIFDCFIVEGFYRFNSKISNVLED